MNELCACGENDPLWSYIGDWQALQDGKTHIVLLNKLIEQGTKVSPGRESSLEDPLARHRSIPLHSRLLYTSLDPRFEACMLEQYAVIESMSRNRCDIYISFEQFNNPGDTIDYLERSPILKHSGFHIAYWDLPGMFFWDHQWEGEYIPFGSSPDEREIKIILSHVFEEIRREPTINAVKRAKKILSQLL